MPGLNFFSNISEKIQIFIYRDLVFEGVIGEKLDYLGQA